jgi:hypothetical protein
MSEKLDAKSSVQKHDGYEKSDAEVKVVIKFLAGLAVLLVVVMLMMSGFYDFLEYTFGRTDAEVSPLVDVAQIPPEPRLQANPAEDLVLIRGWEEERLNSYQWVDEDTGTFRIPIERAIQIVSEVGLPAREDSEDSSEN